MAVVRMCVQCGRHNGPSYTHCMNCGAQLVDPPTDSPETGRDRARRLLEGMTEDRRRLLPPAFLRAVEKQAEEPAPEVTTGGFSTVSGSFPSVDSSGELQLGPAISTFLGPRRRDHAADVVTQPDFPAVLASSAEAVKPTRLERAVPQEAPARAELPEVEPPEPPPAPTGDPPSAPRRLERRIAGSGLVPGLTPLETNPAFDGATEDPIWGDQEMDLDESGAADGSAAGWEEPFAPPPNDSGAWDVEPPPRATDSLDSDIPWSAPTSQPMVDIHSVYEIEPLDPEPEGLPLHRALSTGLGPFGPRDPRFRLIMLPDDGYRGRIHFLQHRLAQTLELDLFKARQYLQRTTPTFLVAGDDRMELRGMSDHLGAGGVVALLLERDRWLDGTGPFEAVSARGDGPGPVTFRDPEGRELVAYRADISWAAVGEIRAEGAIDAFTSLDGASLSLETRTGTYQLLDLFRYSSKAPIRIRSEHFDFDCLGEARKLAAAVNMRGMVRWLSPEVSNPLRPDVTFKRIPAVAGMGARGELDDLAARIPPREVDFTEYTLLLDAGRRHAR